MPISSNDTDDMDHMVSCLGFRRDPQPQHLDIQLSCRARTFRTLRYGSELRALASPGTVAAHLRKDFLVFGALGI